MTKPAQACSKPTVVDAAAIRECLLRLAACRGEGATYCPSEAARQLSHDWRPLMQPVREVAAELVDEGLLVCTQKGVPADPLAARGPIRLARPAKD
ncbi:DUF3253 domain-containing protein [Prosthecobacter fluviatilis]|uniref:DUF3253 domain-containing protein n=1 Tax=Prosthecobacter fluviatilis TaxID=445931 RepID=A0ABW0KZ72_9BACT